MVKVDLRSPDKRVPLSVGIPIVAIVPEHSESTPMLRSRSITSSKGCDLMDLMPFLGITLSLS